MKLHHLPRFRVVKILTQKSVALRAVSLVIVGAVVTATMVSAQGVTFAGALSVLPTSGLNAATGVAVDGAGNVVISDFYNKRAVVLTKTPTGYAPQANLPTVGLGGAYGIALDSAGDVFIPDCSNDRIVELPKTPTGYGRQATLPSPNCVLGGQVELDSAGDVFITAASPVYDNVGELPWTGTTYGALDILTTLPNPDNLALDAAGDIFIVSNSTNVVELQKTQTGYGPPTLLPFSGLNFLHGGGVVLNSAGNEIFVADTDNNRILHEQMTPTGWGPQTTVLTGLNFPRGLFLDSVGDLFVADQNSNRVLELQTVSANLGGAYVCTSGQTALAPCSQTLTLNYNVTSEVTLGTPQVLTNGIQDADFTLASGSTCTGTLSAGSTCRVNVTFAPLVTGIRNGVVEIIDGGGNNIANTSVSGIGVVPTGLQITGLSADYGALYANVTLTGTGFGTTQGASFVTFNGIPAPVLSWSSTSITVSVPYRATTGNVVVTVGGQASNGVLFTVEAYPSISGISPTSGAVGTNVTISGQNLLDAEGHGEVWLNTLSVPIVGQSNASLELEIPAGAVSGVLDVHVNGVGLSTPLFTVPGSPSPVPHINSLSANHGADYAIITLTGTGFGAGEGPSTVTFGGVPATAYGWSNTSIVVTVPNGAVSGNVVVMVGGRASNGVAFTVEPYPTLTGISPSSGPAGTVVTISGENLLDAEGHGTVYFDGVSLPILNPSATSIQVEVPAGAASGVFDVHVNGVGIFTPVFTVN